MGLFEMLLTLLGYGRPAPVYALRPMPLEARIVTR